ncbi:MAG TPA: proline--tRNA ligase [Acidimicrobiales bacterium]|nr:proline--tRNA ligase [Acidimicrobiales bacterium]
MAPRSVLPSQGSDFPQWYQEVLAKAELADNGPVRGTMVIRPYGYAIWERMQAELDARIKAAGVPNAYFPLFIPQSYLHREAAHVEGFSPELAVVTRGGGKELEEPVVVRPTSETIINAYFAKWVQSYRDLPMLINQWANVVRWELRPRLFLRTTEFLWQEGHTAHATEAEARRFALDILRDVYEDFMVEVMAVPIMVGRKTERERFSGAVTTWTCEAMMRDGKALQMGTSHELGQNFARVFNTTFLDEHGKESLVWQTSWGASTRLMGALVMAHGDDAGLRVPPRLAPVQAVVLLVRDEGGAAEQAAAIAAGLTRAGIRTELDRRTDTSFGRRVVDWELKGVPVRLEVGPRELEAHQAVLVRRESGAKTPVSLSGLEAAVATTLDDTQRALFAEAAERRKAGTTEVTTLAEAEEAARTGFAVVPLAALGDEGEATLNAAGVSIRLLMRPDGSLPGAEGDGSDDDLVAVVARAY